jgi:hypothetical protein
LIALALVSLPLLFGFEAGASANSARSAENDASSPVRFVVDVSAGRHPISALIYGINDDKTLDSQFDSVVAETRPGLIRLGGNRWTAYNWENNASNAGSDYYFQNDDYLSSSTTPGAAVLATAQGAHRAGASLIATIPIAGYVSADTSPGGDVRNSGKNYLKTRFKIDKPVDPAPLTNNPNTKDRFVYQDQFVYWLRHAVPGEPILFSLDNEPDLWAYTHAEIHPKPATYAELLAKDLSYARAVKHVWPSAAVTGPVSYGWYGYETLQNAPDSSQDGNFLVWYLAHVRAADSRAHRRLIDYLDLHWYPEARGDGIRITGTETTPGVVAAREQAPRSLWDPSYVEDSWITQSLGNAAIVLIPRLQRQINVNDRGIKLAFTEWNYGAGQDISGGIASADALGIFGKYGVGVAALWPLNGNESFSYGAFAVFRNYDGHGAAFGNTGIAASTSDRAATSVYGSIDRGHPGHLVVVVINKNLTATPCTIQVTGGTKINHAAVYTLTSAASIPKPVPGIFTSQSNTLSYVMPAQSVSVIVPR